MSTVDTSYKGKKLVLCCDGTWLNSDDSYKPPSIIPWNPTGSVSPPSNITRLSQALKPVDSQGRPQIAYYQAGLGTGWTLENKLLGGALGIGIVQNVREAYNFLVTNYVTGDQIYLLGFSRGAFTARSVGGLMTSLGLLNKFGQRYLGVVFEDWLNSGDDGHEILAATDEANGGIPGFNIQSKPGNAKFLVDYLAELKRLHLTQVVDIHAAGVFETVGALGIPSIPLVQHLGLLTILGKLQFWNTALNERYLHAFQALGLDERRASYVPGLWNRAPDNKTTQLKQVWFPGVHSNIGGSYPGNGIGMLTYAWMTSQLSPFLEFEDTTIQSLFSSNQRYLADTASTTELRFEPWGDGLIPNSAKFPRNLLGTHVRTPGDYDEVDRKTGMPEKDRPKLDTGEMMHASVRARTESQGPVVGSSQPGYQSQALRDWKIKRGGAELGGTEWVYTGTKREKRIEVLKEDTLGAEELELLRLFRESHRD